MWIEKRENSKGTRYIYYERFTHLETKKNIRISVTLNSDTRQAQKEAARRLQDKLQEKLSKTATADRQRGEKLDHMTFYQLADEWNEHTRPMVKIETYNNHTNYIKRIKKAIPADLHFLNFSPAMAEKIVYQMYYDECLSFSYSNTTLITIKNIMRYAKKAGYIYSIADFEDIHLKKRSATLKELEKKTNKFLNKEELSSCLKQLRQINPRLSLAMEFIALTGLRCGELLALRVQDYSKEKSLISVNGTLVKTAANGEDIQRGTPKNIYSYRNVELNDRARQIINHIILENKQIALWQRGKYKDRGYIFTNGHGYPYNIQYINKILRRLNIPGKHITTHIFRHTHISILAEQNLPLKFIMQRVGHNDPKTTLSIYTHVTDKMNTESMAKIKSLEVV